MTTIVPPREKTPDAKYLCWALTFALKGRGGLSDTSEPVRGLTRWLGKSRAAFAISECHPGTDIRHVHGAIWLKSPANKTDLKKRLLSIKEIKDLGLSIEERAHSICLKILYSSDWHGSYCLKSSDRTTLHDSLPKDENGVLDITSLEADYPPPDDQRAKHKFQGDPRFIRLEEMYLETVADGRWTHPGHDMETCRAWLETACYCWRIINVITDRRRLNQQAWSLMKFLDCVVYDPEYDTATIDAMLDRIS